MLLQCFAGRLTVLEIFKFLIDQWDKNIVWYRYRYYTLLEWWCNRSRFSLVRSQIWMYVQLTVKRPAKHNGVPVSLIISPLRNKPLVFLTSSCYVQHNVCICVFLNSSPCAFGTIEAPPTVWSTKYSAHHSDCNSQFGSLRLFRAF